MSPFLFCLAITRVTFQPKIRFSINDIRNGKLIAPLFIAVFTNHSKNGLPF